MNGYVLSKKETRALQEKSLEMLLFFKDFCEKHGLLFYFCGGCCIGAVRNGGFIPWDDDVDVFMPREDYQKLIGIFNGKSVGDRYFLQVSTKQKPTKNLFATICDSSTTFIKSFQKDLDINHGIALDILPIDGAPSGRAARVFQIISALLYSLFLIGEVPQNNGVFVKIIAKILLFLVPFKPLRRRISTFCERRMTKHSLSKCKYATELCSGPYYMKKRYFAEDFLSAVSFDFEGYKMPLPVGYDRYLKTAFGDYLTLPPREERAPHHELEYVDTENPHTKYKGIYWEVKQ